VISLSPPSHQRSRTSSFTRVMIASCVLLAGAFILSFCIGRYPIAPRELCDFVLSSIGLGHLGEDRRALIQSLVVESRLPRILGACVIGASLSVSGAAYQAVFRNPLVSPGLLGVLSGAGFGAALAIVLGLGAVGLQVLAFVGGLAAVCLSVGIARIFANSSMIMLIFGGLISSALFTALLSILKYVANPDSQLPDIVFWLLGSLTQINTSQLILPCIVFAVSVTILSRLGQMLDASTMGDDEARTLGVPVHALRYFVIALATILSALTVSLAGMIGWIGLIVPHIARLLSGPGNARLLPLSACIGALFLLLCDDAARGLTDQEIPVGIIADFLGVVSFLGVLRFLRFGWL